jgi:hypothetical protein
MCLLCMARESMNFPLLKRLVWLHRFSYGVIIIRFAQPNLPVLVMRILWYLCMYVVLGDVSALAGRIRRPSAQKRLKRASYLVEIVPADTLNPSTGLQRYGICISDNLTHGISIPAWARHNFAVHKCRRGDIAAYTGPRISKK